MQQEDADGLKIDVTHKHSRPYLQQSYNNTFIISPHLIVHDICLAYMLMALTALSVDDGDAVVAAVIRLTSPTYLEQVKGLIL